MKVKNRLTYKIVSISICLLIIISLLLFALPIKMQADTTYITCVGNQAIIRTAETAIAGGSTWINANNPCSDDGVIHAVALYNGQYLAITGCVIGLFRSAGGKDYTCVASETVGDVAVSTKITTIVDWVCEKDDLLGVYCTASHIYSTSTGGTAVYKYAGDGTSGTATYDTTTYAGYQVSLCGNGNGIFYVDDTGGDDSKFGTIIEPWLTIQNAANWVLAGDTVYVRSGTYGEHVIISNDGLSGNYITYVNYPNETAIIDGAGLTYGSTTGCIQITGDYIVIDGFEIKNAEEDNTTGHKLINGIYNNGHHIIFRNLTIHDCAGSGIAAYGSNLTVDNCLVHDVHQIAGNEGLAFINVDSFEIKNCVVYNVGVAPGSSVGLVEGIQIKGGCSNGSVHDCHVYNTAACININSDGDADSYSIDIYNNLVETYAVDDCAMYISDETDSTSTYSLWDINIYNNVILCGPGGGIITGYNTCKSLQFTIINNTIYGGANNLISVGTVSTYAAGSIIRNNIINADYQASYDLLKCSAAAIAAGIAVDHNLFWDNGTGYNADNYYGTSYIKSNPLFISAGSNYKLQSGSPAIDAGTATSAPSSDYDGTLRPLNNGYDIGAYENLKTQGASIALILIPLTFIILLIVIAIRQTEVADGMFQTDDNRFQLIIFIFLVIVIGVAFLVVIQSSLNGL